MILDRIVSRNDKIIFLIYLSRELICIRIIEGASNHQYAQIGDIVVVIKEAVPNVPLEKLEIIRTVTNRTLELF